MKTLAERLIGSQMAKTQQFLTARLSNWEVKYTNGMFVTLRDKILTDIICDYIAGRLPAAKDFNANSAFCLPTPEATAGISEW